MKNLIIRKPDDWHLHLREGLVLKNIIKYTTEYFGRAIVMPNTNEPVTTIERAVSYKKEILDAIALGTNFDPLMTIFLTDETTKEELKRGYKDKVFFAGKLYPANATTNSGHGVKEIKNIYKLFEIMEDIGMPLLIHGEVTDSNVDIFDREEVFIDRELNPIINRFPRLKVVLEHITTRYAVEFVKEKKIHATITPHHLHINRNAMFFGGLNSDFYCLPVAKREFNRLSLIKAATSGIENFFLGTDSAPHMREWKAFCGCAGIFNAPVALSSYLKVFQEENSLDKFEAFASLNGPKFYNLPPNQEKINLVYESFKVDDFVEISDSFKVVGKIKKFHAGEFLNWRIQNDSLSS